MRRQRATLVACVLFALLCPPTDGAEVCAQYAPRPVRGPRLPPEVSEMSGMAASMRHPDVYWAHNDSDNTFELFGLRADATIVTRVPLRGGSNRDCEDIAVGPCQADRTQSCIYLGDIGDNLERRRQLVIYEIPEPATLDGAPLTARPLAFTYPDRPRNAEALLVDPDDGTIYVVTKEIDSLGTLYRIDGLGASPLAQAVRLHRLAGSIGFAGLTTSASVHPSGTRVLLRTYTQVFEYRGTAEQSLGSILGTEPVAVPGATQPQAEAITYVTGGEGYLLGTEQSGPIYRVDCAPGGG
jgi:hypothetical protein